MTEKFVWVEDYIYIKNRDKPRSRHFVYLKRAIVRQCLPVVIGVLGIETYFMLENIQSISIENIKFTIIAAVSTVFGALGAISRLKSKIELIDGAFYINGICHYYKELEIIEFKESGCFREIGFKFKNGVSNYYWFPSDFDLLAVELFLNQRDVRVVVE